jgi:hypothetical protein
MGFNEDEAHYNYGVLLGLQGRWSEAAAAYRARARGQPAARAGAQQPRAVARDRSVNSARRRTNTSLAVAADPQLRLARYNLGRMLLAARQVEKPLSNSRSLREPQDAESPRYLYRAGRGQRPGRASRRRRRAGASRRDSLPSASDSTILMPPSTATWPGSNESRRGWRSSVGDACSPCDRSPRRCSRRRSAATGARRLCTTGWRERASSTCRSHGFGRRH